MPLRIGNVTIDDSMDLKIGTELVGGLKVGGDIVYQWTPPATVFEWSGIMQRVAEGLRSPRNSAAQLPTEWIANGEDAYLGTAGSLSMPLVTSTGEIILQLSSTPNSSGSAVNPQLTPEVERDLMITFTIGQRTLTVAGPNAATTVSKDDNEPYRWQPGNWRDGTTFYNNTVTGSTMTVRMTAGAAPPPAPESHSFSLTADRINEQAAGKFGGLTETFTLGGQTYTITYLFTHGNGVQFRFSTNAQALAFIAAGYSVDLGISGQSAFSSSLMVNRSDVNWAQYAAYPGRFVAGSTYTITITEAA